ncbi:MAG TPA: hypothetical protein VFU35_08135, partial [Jatrophihabitans sp.]|nr:hypothetical protein [Jatrophihabitans sp.]
EAAADDARAEDAGAEPPGESPGPFALPPPWMTMSPPGPDPSPWAPVGPPAPGPVQPPPPTGRPVDTTPPPQTVPPQFEPTRVHPVLRPGDGTGAPPQQPDEPPAAAAAPAAMPEPAPAAGPPPPVEPLHYPIPPVDGDDQYDGPVSTGPVPTWAFRAPAEPPPGVARPVPVGDLTLDPASLRRRVTVRSGAASMTVDESKLVLRSWLRRTEIDWADVHAFEPRFDAGAEQASAGRLVALTTRGPVELPATHRPVGELRYVHALLDAYRLRALTRH